VSAQVLFWSFWTIVLAVALVARAARTRAKDGSKVASAFIRASSLLGVLLAVAFALSLVYGIHLMHVNA